VLAPENDSPVSASLAPRRVAAPLDSATPWDTSTWPTVRRQLPRVLELRRQAAKDGWWKLSPAGRRLRPQPRVSDLSRWSFPRSSASPQHGVISMNSSIGTALAAALLCPSRAACGPACRVESRLRESHCGGAGPTARTR
jgi:hypothetical protein